MYFHIFSFLSTADLVNAAIVNRTFHEIAYSSHLWTVLDLSRHHYIIDYYLLRHILSSTRFETLQWLSLEGCIGVTPRSLQLISYQCPLLHTLLLTDCCAFPPLTACISSIGYNEAAFGPTV